MIQIFFIIGNSEAKKVRGPSLLKDIWKLPSGKTIDVSFNNRNQDIGKEGRQLANFLGIIARTPELTPLHIDDWRNFDNEEKKKLVDFVKKKFFIPKCGEAWILKSLEKKWKDYKCELKGEYAQKYKTKDALLKNRPSRIPRDQWSGLASYWLSHNAKEMINERMGNSERYIEQPPHSVSWESDVYFQMLENKKSRYVCGLELGPTPSIIWGSRSSLENIAANESSNEVIQRLEQEIIELKETQNEEINMMKQSQEKMQSKLLQMRQLMRKYSPNASMPQSSNGTLGEHIPDANSGYEQVPQTSRIPSVAENA
nr:uncharacterized protein LOC117274462 [Nicotiana tomentosiformis]